MKLSDLTDIELDARIETATQDYRAKLGGRSFHNEGSLAALSVLEPLWNERDKRNCIETQKIEEEKKAAQTKRQIEEILSRRPANPTPEDIPPFAPDSYQRVIKSGLGWAIVRSNTWDLYEFDVYLWDWKRRTSESRRKDIEVRWESRDPEPTQQDIDFASDLIAERSGGVGETASSTPRLQLVEQKASTRNEIADTDKRIIVLAKLEDRENLIKRGRTDIGELNKFETVYIPVAVIWLNEGTHEDVAAAKVYALKNNYRVLCYPLNESDPLGRAKTDIYGSLDWTELEHLR